jgi:hypothetical protein
VDVEAPASVEPESSEPPAAEVLNGPAEPAIEPVDDAVEETRPPSVHEVSPPPSATAPSRPPADTETDEVPPVPPEPAETDLPFSLEGVAALGALSRERRVEVVQMAKVETLGVDEEIKVAGLVLVLEGKAAVHSTITDVAATRLGPGDVIYARGSIPDTLPLRLTATADATKVAVWEQRAIDAVLGSYAGLLEELRRQSDRVQALAGSSMGPIGDRLDESLRTLAIERLEIRALQPDEVFAERGRPVPGMVIMGVGSLELEIDGEVQEKLGPGDFLFATEVLGAGAAPATARAGAKGAIVLFGVRGLAHELMVTCPPLLEIFAGM